MELGILKKLIKFTIIFATFIILLNLMFWILVYLKINPIYSLYQNGMEIRIKPIKYVIVFAHGNFIEDCRFNSIETIKLINGTDLTVRKCLKYHTTRIYDKTYSTIEYLKSLREQGYKKVWGSWCYSNNPLVIYPNGERVEWYDWVSRNEKGGKTLPIFLGFGFLRFSYD